MDKKKVIFRIDKILPTKEINCQNTSLISNEPTKEMEKYDPHKNYFVKYWEQWKENEIILSQIKEKSFILKELNKTLCDK